MIPRRITPQIYSDSSRTDSRFLTNRVSNESPLYVTNSAFKISEVSFKIKYQCFGGQDLTLKKKTAPGPSLKKRHRGFQFGRATSIWANYYVYIYIRIPKPGDFGDFWSGIPLQSPPFWRNPNRRELVANLLMQGSRFSLSQNGPCNKSLNGLSSLLNIM